MHTFHFAQAVLESTWPASGFSGYQQWVKLRNTLRAVTLFRRGLNHRRSIYSDTSSEVDVGSGTSGDSGSSDPLPDGRGDDLIQLMSSQATNLTREEKSSTGNGSLEKGSRGHEQKSTFKNMPREKVGGVHVVLVDP